METSSFAGQRHHPVPFWKPWIFQLINSLRGKTSSREISRRKVAVRKIAVIVNPASGQDKPFLKIFNTTFQDAGYDWELFVTKDAGDGYRLAQKAAADGFEVVAAYGGDGTVMEVACGLRGTGVPMAILPGGTGNVMAVELGIPRDLAAASSLIIQPDRQLRPVDMGQMADKCFILRVGVGFEANVIEIDDRNLKNRYGIFAYVMSALQAAREPTVARYHLVIDGEVYDCEGLGCIVANAGSLGVPGLTLSPRVDPSDGLLDVFVIRKADLPSLISMASGFVGGVTQNENLLHWQARLVSVISSPVQPVQGDGELFGTTPIRVKVLPKSVDIVVPRIATGEPPEIEDSFPSAAMTAADQ
jgi:YegS/Rv2252/BmrU family lipid kinase